MSNTKSNLYRYIYDTVVSYIKLALNLIKSRVSHSLNTDFAWPRDSYSLYGHWSKECIKKFVFILDFENEGHTQMLSEHAGYLMPGIDASVPYEMYNWMIIK